MVNKEVVEIKLERLEAEIKKVGYLIHRNELKQGFDQVNKILEDLSNIRTLLNRETQD
jgi:hypothetical protein